MATIILQATDPNQVSGASSLEVSLGSPTEQLIIFSGIAAPEINVDDADVFVENEVIVKLGVSVSTLDTGVSQIGLASIENDESRFVFATDMGALEIDAETAELQLRVHTVVCGEGTKLHRFSYQIVAKATKVASQISGAIRIPQIMVDLVNKTEEEVLAMFRVTANRVEKDPGQFEQPGSAVAIGKITNRTFVDGNTVLDYVIDGCPFNTPLRVLVATTGLLEDLEPRQVTPPLKIVLTKFIPTVAGINFEIFRVALP
jgi:hypothetical protein